MFVAPYTELHGRFVIGGDIPTGVRQYTSAFEVTYYYGEWGLQNYIAELWDAGYDEIYVIYDKNESWDIEPEKTLIDATDDFYLYKIVKETATAKTEQGGEES